MTDDLRVDLDKLSWDPSSVEVPDAPPITPSADPMSIMLAAYMPTVTNELKAKVADAAAHEQTFSANLSAAKATYQSTEDTNQGTISNAENTVARGQSAAAGGPGGAGGAGGGMSQFGQLISTAMQAASQAAQMPAQALQMVGAVPQTAMQIGQQVQQMAGQSGGGSNGAEGRNAPGQQESPGSPDEDRDREPKHARPDDDEPGLTGRHAAGDVPVHSSAPPPTQWAPSAPPRASGRHAANPAIDM